MWVTFKINYIIMTQHIQKSMLNVLGMYKLFQLKNLGKILYFSSNWVLKHAFFLSV